MAALPWVEKYRPKSVDDVSHQTEVVDSLRSAIENKNLPHLIFYGPPGTGKTSTILACARQLFGDQYRSRVMELNASDERGISVVRDKIKNFAQVSVSSNGAGANGIPPYKLIVLDEADSMTHDAQSALRRTMETYSRVTRFCIICNYISRLIPAIASRCAKFRFKPIPLEAMVERLQWIATSEGADLPEETMAELIRQSEGDMRRAIQLLQSVHQLHGGQIPPSAVFDISGSLPPERIDGVFEVCRSGDLNKAKAYVGELQAEGFPAAQVASQLLDRLLKDDLQIGGLGKAKIATHLAEMDKMLIDGASDSVQMLNLVAFCMRQFPAVARG